MLTISLPTQWIFEINNAQVLNLGPFVDGSTLSSPSPTYLNDLAVTASIYLNRNLSNPAATPGTLVTSFGTAGILTLNYIAASQGLYSGAIANTFNPTPYLSYALVIDASDGAGYIGHWEFPCSAVVRNS